MAHEQSWHVSHEEDRSQQFSCKERETVQSIKFCKTVAYCLMLQGLLRDGMECIWVFPSVMILSGVETGTAQMHD